MMDRFEIAPFRQFLDRINKILNLLEAEPDIIKRLQAATTARDEAEQAAEHRRKDLIGLEEKLTIKRGELGLAEKMLREQQAAVQKNEADHQRAAIDQKNAFLKEQDALGRVLGAIKADIKQAEADLQYLKQRKDEFLVGLTKIGS